MYERKYVVSDVCVVCGSERRKIMNCVMCTGMLREIKKKDDSTSYLHNSVCKRTTSIHSFCYRQNNKTMKGITTIKNLSFTGAAVLLASTERSNGFVLSPSLVTFFAPTHLSAHPGKAGGGGGPGSSVVDSPPDTGFIATELRGAAMRLHTRVQAPKEGEREVPKEPAKPYVPTHMDYLKFLVDSRHVYAALEDIVNEMPELEVYRNNGLERVKGLDIDIEWMASEYDLEIPQVGNAGLSYAEKLRDVAKDSVPAFMCTLFCCPYLCFVYNISVIFFLGFVSFFSLCRSLL